MSQQIKIELIVDDKGTVTFANFAGNATASLDKVKKSANSMGDGFANTWQGLATGVNQAMELFDKFEGAIIQVWELAEKAAQFEEQQKGLDALAKTYGYTADAITKMTQAAAEGKISMIEASQLSAKALTLGFNPDQIIKFTGAAEALTKVIGGNIPEAMDAMERAAATGRSMGLVHYGIIVNLKDALANYAEEHGIATSAIDAHTAMAIRQNLILEEAKKVIERYGEAQDTTADKMERAKAQMADFTLWVGQLAAGGLLTVTDGIKSLGINAHGLEILMHGLADAGVAYLSYQFLQFLPTLATMAVQLPALIASFAAFLGPIGWVSIAIGVAGAAWYAYSSSVDTAAKATDDYLNKLKTESITQLRAELISLQSLYQAQVSVLGADAVNLDADTQQTKLLIGSIKDRIKILQDLARQQAANAKAESDKALKEALAEAAAKKTAQERESAEKNIVEAIRKAQAEIDGINGDQYDKDVARINAEANKYADAGVDQIKIAQYVEAEITIAKSKETERRMKLDADAAQKQQEGMFLYMRIISDEETYAQTEHERSVNKILVEENRKADAITALMDAGIISFEQAQKAWELIHRNSVQQQIDQEIEKAKKIADINYNLVKDIRGYETEAYDMRLAQIDAQADEYEERLINEKTSAEDAARFIAAINAWVTDEVIKAEIQKGKASNDFFAGIQAGYLEWERSQKTWGEAGVDMFKTFANDATKQLDDNLFLFLKGKWSDMKFDFGAILDDMLKILTHKIGEMIVQWGLYQAAEAASSAFGFTMPGGITNPFASSGTGALGSLGSAAGAAGSLGGGGNVLAGINVDPDVPLNVIGANTLPAEGAGVAAGGMSTGVIPIIGQMIAGSLAANQAANAIVGEGNTGGRIALDIFAPFFDPIGTLTSIGNFFGFGSHAGFGSSAPVTWSGKWGEMPTFGAFHELPRSSGPAPADLTNAFLQGVAAELTATFDSTKQYLATLSSPEAQAASEALNSKTINYFPYWEGITSAGGKYGTELALTQDNAENIKNFLGSIPDFILGQVENVLPALPSHAAGLDFVPRDNYVNRAHYGEAILQPDEAAAYRAGKQSGGGQPQQVHVHLDLDRNTVASFLLDITRDGIKVIDQRGIAYA